MRPAMLEIAVIKAKAKAAAVKQTCEAWVAVAATQAYGWM
jgi:hypothetical protein